jgi:hypothetical protein
LEILNEAITIVTAVYPGSRLFAAEGTPSIGMAFEEADVDIWRFLFLGPLHANRATTVVLEYHSPNFRSPVLKCLPFRGDGVIEIGLEQAIAIKNDSGNIEPFQKVNLHWPFPPGDAEPFYVFGGIGTPFVFVGINSGAVKTLDAGPLDRSG